MKHLLILGFILCLFPSISDAQFQGGIRIGASSFLLPQQLIDLDNEQLQVTLKEGYYGLNGGVYVRFGEGLVALQPELIFNSNSVGYVLEDLSSTGIQKIIKERYYHLDMPVMLVIKPSILRFYAGPVGHYSIQSMDEISNWNGWKGVLNNMTIGYQAGGGIQFNGFSVDLKYEGRILADDNKLVIDGKEIELSKNPSRLLLTLGFKLF
jgi:hypothetical protein